MKTVLLDWVRALEGKNPSQRRDILTRFLQENAIPFEAHPFSALGYQGTNLIVSNRPGEATILVTAHYDSVPNSPGANDNASSVAVLMRLCQTIKSLSLDQAVRFVFTDGEEAQLRVGPFRWGRCGSRAFVKDPGWKHIRAVYNLEWCGEGDFFALWPVSEAAKQTTAFRMLQETLEKEGLPYGTVDIPPLIICSDDRTFRRKGIAGAFTISLVPGKDVERLRYFFAHRWEMLKFVAGFRQQSDQSGSTLFQRLHSHEDSSAYLKEESMETVFDVICKTLTAWGKEVP